MRSPPADDRRPRRGVRDSRGRAARLASRSALLGLIALGSVLNAAVASTGTTVPTPVMPTVNTAPSPDFLVLRVPLFYQAAHIKRLLQTCDPGNSEAVSTQQVAACVAAAELQQPDGKRSAPQPTPAEQHQRSVLTQFVTQGSSAPFSIIVTSDRDQAICSRNGELSTGRVELAGPHEILGRAMEVIDALDRPDPTIDVDILIFRISGDDATAARQYRELMNRVATAQGVGESLNLLSGVRGLPENAIASLLSLIPVDPEHPGDNPILYDAGRRAFRVRSWRELQTQEQFDRRTALRNLFITLSETRAVKDSQAKGMVIRRLLLGDRFAPAELVQAVYLTRAVGPERPVVRFRDGKAKRTEVRDSPWTPGRSDLKEYRPIEHDGDGRELTQDQYAVAALQFATMDDRLIAGFLGADFNGRALEPWRQKIASAGGPPLVTIDSPRDIDRILSFTQLQPRTEPMGRGRQAGLTWFDTNALLLTSQATVQLRSGYQQALALGTVSSTLHRVSSEDIQNFTLGLLNLVKSKRQQPPGDGGTGTQQDFKLDTIRTPTGTVVVSESLSLTLTAFAGDLTSTHYADWMGSGSLSTDPSLSQSSLGSIRLDLDNQITVQSGEGGQGLAAPPLGTLTYSTVLDSTSYRPNLVLAANFDRELRTHTASLPAWVTAAGGVLTHGLGLVERAILFVPLANSYLSDNRYRTTQALALVVVPRPRTPLPAQDLLVAALEDPRLILQGPGNQSSRSAYSLSQQLRQENIQKTFGVQSAPTSDPNAQPGGTAGSK